MDSDTKNLFNSISGISTGFIIATAYSVLGQSLLINLVLERGSNLKHQQIVSGASIFAYWSSTYIVDIIKGLIPGLVGIIAPPIFGIDVSEIAYFISYLPYGFCSSCLFWLCTHVSISYLSSL
jgi:hypothetical protein